MHRTAPQVAIDEALHFGRRAVAGAERGALRRAANPVDAGLHLVEIGTDRGDVLFERILPRDDIEAGVERIGGVGNRGLDIHGAVHLSWAGEGVAGAGPASGWGSI